MADGDEQKFFDSNETNFTVTQAGAVQTTTMVAGIQQGAGESQRVGRKVVVRKVLLNGDLILPGSATATFTEDVARIIVFWDKQTNGAAATVTQILASASYLSYRNLQQTGRFSILSDKKYTINAAAGNGTSTGDKRLHWKLNLKCNIPLEFSASTGAVADLTTNNIGVLAISGQGHVQCYYYWRVRYSDR